MHIYADFKEKISDFNETGFAYFIFKVRLVDTEILCLKDSNKYLKAISDASEINIKLINFFSKCGT